MKSLWRTAILAAFVLAVLGSPAHADCIGHPDLLVNGDFENGSANWTKTLGYFGIFEAPSGSGNHVAQMHGSSSDSSKIRQTFTAASAGWHFVYAEMSGYGSCYVAATIQVGGGQPVTQGDDVQYGAFTYTFYVPSGVTSGSIEVVVTCPTVAGHYIQVDNVCIAAL